MTTLENEFDVQDISSKGRIHILSISSSYADAFRGYPWFENLSTKEAQTRMEKDMVQPGFDGIFLLDKDRNAAGALWYYLPDTEKIRMIGKSGGEALVNFVGKVNEQQSTTVVYFADTFVAPQYQGKNLSAYLKSMAMEKLQKKADRDGSLLLLTRMRDDNFAIIKINEELGMERSGVRVPASGKPGLFHEFWYKILQPIFINE